MKIKLDEGAFLPERAHRQDAGLDLKSPRDELIMPRGYAVIDTGVHVEIPYGMTGFLKSKSGLNVKYNITSEGVIDSGYTGSIVVKLYNHGDMPYKIQRGDKISQLVILPVVMDDVVQVDWIDGGDRGSNGFGSTGP